MIRKVLFICCFLVLFASTSFSAIRVGEQLPVFTGTDLNGQPLDLKQYVGEKPMMMVFWTSWCGDCPEKLAAINELVRRYGKEDIQFVGVNVGMNDTVEDAKAFIKENKMTYPNVFDKTGELSEKYQLNKVFALILVSKDGTMMMRLNNIPDMDSSVLEMLNSYNSPYSRKGAGDAVNGEGINWHTLISMI